MTVTKAQIGIIHTLAAKAGLDDDAYRDFLHSFAAVSSSKELTAAGADRVINRLREISGQATGVKGAVAGLDTPAARKLRALWIAGWNLGLVQDRTDRAMLAFLERQTKVSHTRFLSEPGQATAAIEALKSWLARAGKVEWRDGLPPNDALHVGVKPGADAAKHAVLKAQWQRLVDAGAVKPFVASEPLGELPDYAYRVARKNGWCFFVSADYDAVSSALGRRLRAALARRTQGGAHAAAS
jgi:Protein of unknown function (DUF1018)